MKKKKICSRCSRSLFWIYFALFRVWNLPQPLLQLGFTHEQKKKEKNNSFRSILDPSSGCHECGYQVVWQFVHKSWTTNKKCLCQTSNWCQRKVWGAVRQNNHLGIHPHTCWDGSVQTKFKPTVTSPIGLSTSVLKAQVLYHHLWATSDRIWTRGLSGGGYSD